MLFLEDTGDCVGVSRDWDEYNLSPNEAFKNRFPNEPSHWRQVDECHVAARDEAEAVKIAADVRRVFLATGSVVRIGEAS